MRVTFWGTRGSVPASLNAAGVRRKIVNAIRKADGRTFADEAAVEAFVDNELSFPERGTFGGNSSCIEIETGRDDEFLVCDLGSGAREFGLSAMGRRQGKPAVYNVIQSHVHWDHIMGFPFVVPAYIPGNTIRIHGCHADIEAAFRRQQSAPHFPVAFDALGARIEFVVLTPDVETTIGGFRVTPCRQVHGNDSYGYRLEKDGKVVVYSTDSEHRLGDVGVAEAFAAFFRDADLVIFDAMYSLADAVSVKADWGHSSNIVGVELCQLAHAKRLALFHHEPAYDDERLDALWHETLRLEEITREGPPLEVSAAYDGLVIDV